MNKIHERILLSDEVVMRERKLEKYIRHSLKADMTDMHFLQNKILNLVNLSLRSLALKALIVAELA